MSKYIRESTIIHLDQKTATLDIHTNYNQHFLLCDFNQIDILFKAAQICALMKCYFAVICFK